MVDLDVKRLGKSGLGAGLLDADELRSFGGVRNEISTFDRNLN